MPPVKSKLGKRNVIHGQCREMIAKVYEFMKLESIHGVTDLHSVQRRVSNATSISSRTLCRIIKENNQLLESEQSTSFSTPGKRRSRKVKSDIDPFNQAIVREIIYNFHLTENEMPTVLKLRRKLTNDIGFKGGCSTLRSKVKKMGFRWRKTVDNQQTLVERHETRIRRIQYLRAIKQYRSDSRPIVYTVETYMYSPHSIYVQNDDSNEGIKCPLPKVRKMVVMCAGGEGGIVPGALAIHKSTQTGEFHQEMNYNIYEKWLKEKLIPNLNPKSVLVIEEAPYHNLQHNPAPISFSSRKTMQDWLQERNIPFSEHMLKPELYELIKLHKSTYKTYRIDALLAEHGHTVLRLQQCLSELNPMRKLWKIAKDEVFQNMTLLTTIADVKKLLEEKFSVISINEWRKVCKLSIDCEHKFMLIDKVADDMSEKFIINMNDSSTDDNNSSADDLCDNDSSDNSEDEDSAYVVPSLIWGDSVNCVNTEQP